MKKFLAVLILILVLVTGCNQGLDSKASDLEVSVCPSDSCLNSIDAKNQGIVEGIQSISWIDDDTAVIRALIDVNCAEVVANAGFYASNQIIYLAYDKVNPFCDETGCSITECHCLKEVIWIVPVLKELNFSFEVQEYSVPYYPEIPFEGFE